MVQAREKIRTAAGEDERADVKNIQERERRGLVHRWVTEKRLGFYSGIAMVMC